MGQCAPPGVYTLKQRLPTQCVLPSADAGHPGMPNQSERVPPQRKKPARRGGRRRRGQPVPFQHVVENFHVSQSKVDSEARMQTD